MTTLWLKNFTNERMALAQLFTLSAKNGASIKPNRSLLIKQTIKILMWSMIAQINKQVSLYKCLQYEQFWKILMSFDLWTFDKKKVESKDQTTCLNIKRWKMQGELYEKWWQYFWACLIFIMLNNKIAQDFFTFRLLEF